MKFKYPKKIQIGEDILFNFSIRSNTDVEQKLVIDYAVHHVKSNGKTTAKIFKIKSLILNGSSTTSIAKKHSFKKITTRKYYPGTHGIEICQSENNSSWSGVKWFTLFSVMYLLSAHISVNEVRVVNYLFAKRGELQKYRNQNSKNSDNS